MRKTLALVTAALLACAALFTAPAAGAATSSTHPRVTTLISSSQWIVYRQKTTSANMRPYLTTGGTIYATDVAGQEQPLPSFTSSVAGLYLTGSILAQAQNQSYDNGQRQVIRWRDLNTGKTGVYVNQNYEILLGAAPDGWLTETYANVDSTYGPAAPLTYVHTDGTRTPLGDPFPQGENYVLSVSDTGIIATPRVNDEVNFKSKVQYMAWAKLSTTWKTLYTTSSTQRGVECTPSSTTYVACGNYPNSDGTPYFGLIALNGSGATWIKTKHPTACPALNVATLGSNLVAIETITGGNCTKGKLIRFNVDGTLVSGGSHHYSSTSLLAGLGGFTDHKPRIIVSSLDQRHIDTLTGVTRTPYVLVRV